MYPIHPKNVCQNSSASSHILFPTPVVSHVLSSAQVDIHPDEDGLAVRRRKDLCMTRTVVVRGGKAGFSKKIDVSMEATGEDGFGD